MIFVFAVTKESELQKTRDGESNVMERGESSEQLERKGKPEESRRKARGFETRQ